MNRETPPLMLRLAYVKFVRVMEDLEDAAAAESACSLALRCVMSAKLLDDQRSLNR
jgi:hypothetical protein